MPWAPPCITCWPAGRRSTAPTATPWPRSTATPSPRRSRRPTRPSARGSCGWWSGRWPSTPRTATSTPAAMLRDLEALLHGEPTGIPMHPILPACDPDRVLRFEFRWELDSSPRQLWPLVTNTDRLDRAIGFPAMKYTTRYEEGRGVRTFAEGRKAGMTEVGEEHPYEWVEPRRMGVMREYSQGPFVWLVSSVELLPRAGGGTTLVHRLHLEPRTWTIRVGSRWGVGGGLRKSLEKVYRRIDATVQGRARRDAASAAVDPFEEPDRLPAARRQRLERLLDRLSERGVNAGGRRAAGRVPGRRAGPGGRADPPAGPGRSVRARSRPGRRRLPARRPRGPARAALGPALPGLPDLLPGHRHAPRDRRARPLRGLPPRLPARLRQLDRADLPGASRGPRGRPGDLLRRRAGAFAARAGAGPRGAGRADRAGARADRGPVSAPRPATALDGRHPGPRLDGPAAMGARPGAGTRRRWAPPACAPAARCWCSPMGTTASWWSASSGRRRARRA